MNMMGIWLPTEFAEAFHFWKTHHNPPSGCGFPKGAQGAILTPTLDTPTRQPCGLSIPLPITMNNKGIVNNVPKHNGYECELK